MPGLFHGLEVNAIRKLADQLVQQTHGLGSIGLQGFHNALACEQCLRLLLQLPDFIDLLVELDDLGFQVLVAFHLVFDATRKKRVHRNDNGCREPDRHACKDEELLLLGLAPRRPMRQ